MLSGLRGSERSGIRASTRGPWGLVRSRSALGLRRMGSLYIRLLLAAALLAGAAHA